MEIGETALNSYSSFHIRNAIFNSNYIVATNNLFIALASLIWQSHLTHV